jgi:hypothetical protein
MQLKCPECGLTKARECLSWRLETCPSCSEDGHSVYLTDASRTGSERPSPSDLAPVVQRFLEGPRAQH